MFSSITGIVLESSKYCVIILILLQEEKKENWLELLTTVKTGLLRGTCGIVASPVYARTYLLAYVPAELPLIPVVGQRMF